MYVWIVLDCEGVEGSLIDRKSISKSFTSKEKAEAYIEPLQPKSKWANWWYEIEKVELE